MSVIDLPLPPSVNRLWRSNRGRVHRSDPYAAWLREAGWALLQQRPKRLTGWVRVSIAAGVPDRRRRDLDNLLKALLDLLVQHQVIETDADVAALDARWDDLVPGGRVCLEVRSVVKKMLSQHHPERLHPRHGRNACTQVKDTRKPVLSRATA
jgi:crossover junction endodeoxyribonuclease RusA